jgi:DNA-binding NarL/FixJ family response regulator
MRTFILEDRDLYRRFLGRWLREEAGCDVLFFDSAESLEASPEMRQLELLAVHLLPSRTHFQHGPNGHSHAVYGENMDASTIHWCRKNGVKGLLDLRDGVDDWKQCLATIGNGGSSETPAIRRNLLSGHAKGISRLSRRETEVARMLVKGFSAKQVAASLGTSEGTVKNQRKAVYKKLGIIRATQLAGAMGYGKAR